MHMDDKRKIALVTGGSRGLGKDMATRLAEKGFDVIITWHSKKEAAEAVALQLESTGVKAAPLQLDVSDFKSLSAFIGSLKDLLQSKWNTSKFDCLVNNAGVGASISVAQATEEDFDRLTTIHFKTVFFLTQQCLDLLNDGGRIINISSGSVRFAVPGYAIYASAKSAVETFTKYLSKEVGSRGITVNVVAPGAIETDFNNAAIRNDPGRKAYIASATPLGRAGVAEDIGGVVAFLCTEDARWINGQRIEVSGGIN